MLFCSSNSRKKLFHLLPNSSRQNPLPFNFDLDKTKQTMPTARLCWYGHRAKLPDVGETMWAVAMHSCVKTIAAYFQRFLLFIFLCFRLVG
ncbi:hypothetical protein ES332_D03G139000v1 [Gossypium tomentosum]|uniref:Uncharacterized protein n=1 Tax=Gossypium tomentosum TaxID=34277 RepID=A0A5D2LM36_GOSTO|nr:hypothetical protein ES332_D03G139000v1 [Gossypium tomentosum]